MKRLVYVSQVLIFVAAVLGLKINAYSQVNTFSYTGGIVQYTVPAGVTSVYITAKGAQGGGGAGVGGNGAIVGGQVAVTPGDVLKVLVGQEGQTGNGYNIYGFGGGGGSFVTTIGDAPVIIAGGGGGAGISNSPGQDGQVSNNAGSLGLYGEMGGTSGNGGDEGVDGFAGCGGVGHSGGGLLTDGLGQIPSMGKAFVNGGAGGTTNNVDNCIFSYYSGGLSYGGFGGGGAGGNGGGGGGGYSGGAGGSNGGYYPGGGGGGSYVSGTNQTMYTGNMGDGLVTIIEDIAPYFVNATQQSITVCQDAGAYDFSSIMDVNDGDNGQTETWSIYSGPSNGLLSGFNSTATSNGGVVSTSSLTYTPASGFNGVDQFVIEVNDGNGGFAYDTINVTVNPKPDVTASSDQIKCNATMTDSAYFLGSIPMTTFNWTNSHPSIGLVASGSGDIPAFTAMNGSFAIVTATITVTPTANTCAGDPVQLLMTINPTPDVMTSTGGQARCNNASTAADVFSSNVSGTTYTWVNSNTNIGLASTGNTNILSFTATNIGTSTITGNITVTPEANNCIGTPITFVDTVYPTPMLSTTLAPTEVCDSALLNYVPNSLTSGTSFGWSRASNPDILNGPAANTGAISEYLKNTTVAPSAVPVMVDYVYTLSANGCVNTQTVTATVNPKLLLTSSLTPADICESTMFSYVPTSSTPGVTFQWNRNPVYGISNAGATNSFNPLEYLNDTTALPVVVTYNYNIILNACSNTQDVVVTIKPDPTLTSTLSPSAVCDSTPFKYVPTSATPGTSFTWSRPSIIEISNPAISGADSIADTLVNTATYPVNVPYSVTSLANGCSSTEFVNLTVNPLPKLSSTTTPSAKCSGELFSYKSTSATIGTTFAWSRAALTGISNPANSAATDSIKETLVNTTPDPINVIYIDTLTFSGCKNTQKVTVAVKPLPKLNSAHKLAQCDSLPFNYPPTSATAGSAFAWSRAYVPGIDVAAGSGIGNPNEQLINTTNFNLNVVYVYTLTANGCTYSPDSVVVLVHPTPKLSSSLTPVTCSGTNFAYTPTSNTPATAYTWSHGKVSGIAPVSGSGSGNINEMLTDSTTSAVNVVYTFTVTVNGVCPHKQNIVVKVNPAPDAPVLAVLPPSNACSNTQYQNIGTASEPPAGTSYIWSAINANIMATGKSRQNALVTFNTPGEAKVIVTSSINATSCQNADTFNVTVSSSVSENPQVLYYNGQFLCLQNEVDSYQWGYDDAITLDSTLFQGEVNQVYLNNAPDFVYQNFWVMTKHNGCMQKTYYNRPTGVTNINTDVTAMKVFPNPASSTVNVELNATLTGDVQVELVNLLGQKVSQATITDRRATFNVGELPAGCYLVDCYHNGVKIANAKFIKN